MGTTERDRGVQPSLAGATGADADAELEARLRRANERIERLCEATDRATSCTSAWRATSSRSTSSRPT